MGERINEINYPTIAGGFLNNAILTVFLLRVLWFLPTIPLLGGGMPNMTLGSDNQQSN